MKRTRGNNRASFPPKPEAGKRRTGKGFAVPHTVPHTVLPVGLPIYPPSRRLLHHERLSERRWWLRGQMLMPLIYRDLRKMPVQGASSESAVSLDRPVRLTALKTRCVR